MMMMIVMMMMCCRLFVNGNDENNVSDGADRSGHRHFDSHEGYREQEAGNDSHTVHVVLVVGSW